MRWLSSAIHAYRRRLRDSLWSYPRVRVPLLALSFDKHKRLAVHALSRILVHTIEFHRDGVGFCVSPTRRRDSVGTILVVDDTGCQKIEAV